MYTDKRRIQSAWFLSGLALLVASISGCGNEAAYVPDTAPYVLSTVPALGAAGVALNSPITATFNKPVNCSTVTATSFTVTSLGSVAVSGAVTCSGSTATFTPAAALALHTLYTAVITAAVTDVAGLAMVQPYSWNFEAIVAPSVVSTTPAPGASGLPFNQTFTATFLVLPAQDPDSKGGALNCATLTSSTFTVTAGSVPVAGTVTCSGATATFTPTAPLTPGATYTATLTTGVQNTSGVALPTAYVWTSTTGTPPVVLSTIPSSGATGVLLTQPIGVTFNKLINCATLYSPAKTFTLTGPGTTAVAGTVSCSGNGATFLPSNPLATNTVYTATITTGVTDLQGISLASNYVWNFITAPAIVVPIAPTVMATAPANLAAGVPINQAVSATFSGAMNPATINTGTFTLTAPGGVVVSGTVSYTAAGSIATFTPTVPFAGNTTYVATIKTGAQDLSGTGLANNYVWTFTTGAAPDTTRPTVIYAIPSPNGVTGVPTSQTVSATFSEAMNPLTLNATTFTVTGPGATAVAGIVTYSGVANTVTFTPTAPLAPNTLFTATVTTGAQDLAGNSLASNYVFTFTTAAAVVVPPPVIVSTSPANAAINVPISQAVSVTFSKAMNPLTINTTTFIVTGPGGTTIAGTIAYNAVNFIATFTPIANLGSNTIYTANITTGATDLAGDPLGSGGPPNPWSFTTATVVPPPAVNLGTATLFGDFGGFAGMTNSGPLTVINGNIGTTAVSTGIVDFHDESVIVGGIPQCSYTETPVGTGGQVNGKIYSAHGTSNTIACPDEGTAATAAIAAQAGADALSAYNAITPASLPGGLDVSVCPGCGGGLAGELGNRTLAPGVYKSAPGTYAISAGPLTLDGQGNPNAVWVFQMANTLTVGTPTSNQSVILINGAQATNIYWQVGTAATIEPILGGGTMQGTVIAQAGITVSTAGVAQITTINGRLLSLGAAITIVNTVINVPFLP